MENGIKKLNFINMFKKSKNNCYDFNNSLIF